MIIPPFIEIIVIYLLGGVTFIPIVLLTVYCLSCTKRTQHQEPFNTTITNTTTTQSFSNAYAQNGKKGWIRLTKTYKPKESESNVAFLMSYVQGGGNKRQKEHVYAELKCGALFIYKTNQTNEDCNIIIPVHNYTISLYNPGKQQQKDQDMFSKSTWLKLTPKLDNVSLKSGQQVLIPHLKKDGSYCATSPYLTTHNELFITCDRSVDKEDWYFGLLAANGMISDSSSHLEMMDVTHFDASAMQALISTVQQDTEYREMQWLNAILGRLFLGLYKTDDMRQYLQEKISKKAKKIKRPKFLGDIVVQSVDIGDSIPYVTQPKLLSLTPEGNLEAEAMIQYAGGLRVVIQTDITWKYSSLLKPIRVPFVLSIMLKKMSGKLLVKVKPPPTNRCWFGFYETPDMDWDIQPTIVSHKLIHLSVITKAIQSKIREFVMDNVVLPNMDDFAFCSSDGYGGIFGKLVPKPSSPNSAMIPANVNLDMLGNKVNKTAIPPKKIVTHQQIKQEMAPSKTPVRRATVGVVDVPSILTTAEKGGVNNASRSRGYSNPNLRQRSNSSSSSDGSTSGEVPAVVVSSPTISSAMSTGRRMASNMRLRKKRPPPPPLVPVSSEEEGSEESQGEPKVASSSIKTNSIHDSDTGSVVSFSSSSLSSFSAAVKSSNKSLLSKFSGVGRSAKLNYNNKKKLFATTDNLFNKKKVPKEMLAERNRELLESHNRKMINLFLDTESTATTLPSLPPRPINDNNTTRSSPSLSSSSSDENLMMTATLEYIPKQTENTTSILIHDNDYSSSLK